MKVVCINDKHIYGWAQTKMRIKEGEVYEVISEFVYPPRPDWGLWYELDIHPGVGYPPEYFIPLSSVDETELIKERLQEA